MRFALALLASLASLVGCSGGSGTPDGACSASNPACVQGATDSGIAADARPVEQDAAAEATMNGGSDSSATPGEDACVLWVDDAGVTQGCGSGGMGPGDRDDGGDASPPPPPDAALDATGLGFGASCWDNTQCASDLCFDYKARGQFCSRICSQNADCPLPSPGCNGMGVCRQPDGP